MGPRPGPGRGAACCGCRHVPLAEPLTGLVEPGALADECARELPRVQDRTVLGSVAFGADPLVVFATLRFWEADQLALGQWSQPGSKGDGLSIVGASGLEITAPQKCAHEGAVAPTVPAQTQTSGGLGEIESESVWFLGQLSGDQAV